MFDVKSWVSNQSCTVMEMLARVCVIYSWSIVLNHLGFYCMTLGDLVSVSSCLNVLSLGRPTMGSISAVPFCFQ